MVIKAQNLLVLSSKPAPVSMTKWRRPESRCWKKAQVRPTQTISDHFQVAQAVKVP
jgi:hypothetical protein